MTFESAIPALCEVIDTMPGANTAVSRVALDTVMDCYVVEFLDSEPVRFDWEIFRYPREKWEPIVRREIDARKVSDAIRDGAPGIDGWQ